MANIPKLIRACEEYQHWLELRVLYQKYEEYDNAVTTMIQHTPEAFEHPVFKDIITKVANTEILYKAIKFYIDTHPTMIKEYLQSVQHNNLQAVNDALHELYVEAGDFDLVRKSVETYDNVDLLKLAQDLEKHELCEFRRLAAFVFKKKGKHSNSVELSKADGMYKDAMETAAESGDQALCEELLRFFVEEGRSDCFASSLYTMYDYLLPDVVLELAYRFNMMDFALPYMVQVTREYTNRVQELEKAHEKMSDKTDDLNQLAPTNQMGGYDMGMGQMALMGPGQGGMTGMGAMGGGMGGGMQQGGFNQGGMQQQGGMGGGYGGY